MRRLFKGGVYFNFISHWEEEERGRACCTGKVLGLNHGTANIAKILKREPGGRAAKYGHFDRELRNIVKQGNKFTWMM